MPGGWSLQGYYRKGEIECATEHYKDAVESFKVMSYLVGNCVDFPFNDLKNVVVWPLSKH